MPAAADICSALEALTPGQLRVYDALVAAAEAEEPCPGNRKLGHAAGLSLHHVITVIAKLQARGLIAIERDSTKRRITITASGSRTAFTRHAPPSGLGRSSISVRRDLFRPSAAQCKLVRNVARAFGLREEDLRKLDRSARSVRARQAACWVMRRRFPHLSYFAIAKSLGQSDHSMVIYYVRRAERLRETEPAFCKMTDQLLETGVVREPMLSEEDVERGIAALARQHRPVSVSSQGDFLRQEIEAEFGGEDDEPDHDERLHRRSLAGGSRALLARIACAHPARCGVLAQILSSGRNIERALKRGVAL